MKIISDDTIVRIHSDDYLNGSLAVVLGITENDIYRVLVYRHNEGTPFSKPTIMHYHKSCLWSITKSIDAIVRRVLDDIGARPDWKGYEHLAEAITIAMENKDISIGEIYYKIADRAHINWHNVERRMRSSIADVFENAESCVLRYYFPGYENDHNPHLTNRQFVFGIVRHIRKEYSHA